MTYISPKPQTLPKCLSVSESLSENNSEDLIIKTGKEKKKKYNMTCLTVAILKHRLTKCFCCQ